MAVIAMEGYVILVLLLVAVHEFCETRESNMIVTHTAPGLGCIECIETEQKGGLTKRKSMEEILFVESNYHYYSNKAPLFWDFCLRRSTSLLRNSYPIY